MKVKVFEKNEKGKIEFTRKELEALLNEVYNDGHSDGYQAGRDSKTWTWSSPSITTPYYSTTNSTPTIKASDLYCSISENTLSDTVTLTDTVNTLSVSYG